jgi:two-component sensor histidine kinase
MPQFNWLRREIVAPRSLAFKLGGVILAIALPGELRWLADRGAGGAPFVTFWPAVLLATAFLGWRWGVAAALGSTAVALFVFIPNQTAAGAPVNLRVVLPFFLVGVAVMILVGHLLRSSVLALEDRVRQSETFNEELQHRAKNALQMIQALASRAALATDPAEFYKTLSTRLQALAESNELLRFGVNESCQLNDLIAIALRPFQTSQIAWSGPDCRVGREVATPLTMALHELGTNSSKYGALSTPGGSVSLTWDSCDSERTELVWIERDGPPVAKPKRFGVGSRLLQAHGPLRKVDVDYAPTGLQCRIRIDQVSA